MTGAPESVVVVAMEEEAQPFLERADSVGDPLPGIRESRRDLVIGGRTVALIRSGIGFVNATAAAAHVFYTLGADTPVVSAGSAGGLKADVQVGEVIVGSRYVNLNADATAFGYLLGQVPGMPADYEPEPRLAEGALTAQPGATVRAGVIGSSETFVTAARALAFRADFPEVAAVDMESAALAQFAHTHGQAFLSVRAVSDLCAPDGTQFLTHIDDAAARAADLVLGLLRAL